jgi:succinylglutamate desuccinylase/aspartoacylase family protein
LDEYLPMQRLGKNVGRYLGDTLDIQQTLRDIEAAAQEHGWKSETFFESKDKDLKLFALTRSAKTAISSPSPPRSEGEGRGEESLRAQGESPFDVRCSMLDVRCSQTHKEETLNTQEENNPRRIYISAGIHGDEPAGPLAALKLLQENQWPENLDLWFCPCLNPLGFAANTRENARGIDLNREYLNPLAEEIKAHITWLERQPNFDLCLLLHEDWESHGFYLYEQNPERRRSLAEPMIEAISQVCPIDPNEEIEGRPAQNGIIRPSFDPASRPKWPEAFYLITHKTRLSYTLEAPSDYPISTRVDALVTAVRTAVKNVTKP